MKKKKRLLLVGVGFIFSSVLVFTQFKTTQEEAEEIAQLNEVRAETRMQKANMYKIFSIMLGVGGVACIGIALLKKKNEWDY